MTIKWQIRMFPDRGYHWRTNRQVGHKMAVHYVQMHYRRATLGCRLYLIGEPCKIGGQNGRSKLDQKGLSMQLRTTAPDQVRS
jgi:hypothetical protein